MTLARSMRICECAFYDGITVERMSTVSMLRLLQGEIALYRENFKYHSDVLRRSKSIPNH